MRTLVLLRPLLPGLYQLLLLLLSQNPVVLLQRVTVGQLLQEYSVPRRQPQILGDIPLRRINRVILVQPGSSGQTVSTLRHFRFTWRGCWRGGTGFLHVVPGPEDFRTLLVGIEHGDRFARHLRG